VLPIIGRRVLADGTNLIANPSLEIATAGDPMSPAGWSQGGWGTNTRSYSYANTGHASNRSAQVQISSYTSGDAKWFFAPVAVSSNTQYNFSDYYESSIASDVVAQLDDGNGNYTYQDLGVAPASATWKQYQANVTTATSTQDVTIFHLIAGVGMLTIDDVSLSLPGLSSAPMVNVTAPQNSSTVQGKVTLSATAGGTNPVSNVQFMADGQNIGAPITTAPYTYVWDSTLYGDGAHVITAKVTDSTGATAQSAGVTLLVSNSNLVPNPSLETTNPSDATAPAGWYQGNWGNNTATFSYLSTGHSGNHSIRIAMSNFVDGGANWSYSPQAVKAGQIYEFSDYYQSNVVTQVLVAVHMSDGTTQYVWLGNPYTSDGTWTKFYATFTMPAGAVSATAYQSLAGNGYFVTDDYTLRPYVPQGFSSPLVSITFDDSIASQYKKGLPILQKDGLKGTFYVISGDVGICNPDISSICYMTKTQVQGLYAAGQEVGSHTVDHPDLTTLTTTQVDQELATSQATLTQWIKAPVTDFAAPYGDVNLSVLTESQKYYASQRGVEAGYNDKSNYNQQDLLVQDVDSDTTVAQVKSYIDYAKATNTWLILVFHDINVDSTVDPGYDTTPANFATEMAYLKASKVTVATMAQALQLITPQLGK